MMRPVRRNRRSTDIDIDIDISQTQRQQQTCESCGSGPDGDGEKVQICHNGQTLELSPIGAINHLKNHPTDTIGPCPSIESDSDENKVDPLIGTALTSAVW